MRVTNHPPPSRTPRASAATDSVLHVGQSSAPEARNPTSDDSRAPIADYPTEGPDGFDGFEAFDAFCRSHHGSVVGLAFSLTGDWSTAEDLAQDAFLAAFARWDRLRGYDNPGAWVRRVVANRAVSWRRRATNELRAITRLGNRRTTTTVEPPEVDDALWAEVRRLPRRQAQVFALTYVDDLDLDQVAAVLGISSGTAKTHLGRSRAALSKPGPCESTPSSNVAPTASRKPLVSPSSNTPLKDGHS